MHWKWNDIHLLNRAHGFLRLRVTNVSSLYLQSLARFSIRINNDTQLSPVIAIGQCLFTLLTNKLSEIRKLKLNVYRPRIHSYLISELKQNEQKIEIECRAIDLVKVVVQFTNTRRNRNLLKI